VQLQALRDRQYADEAQRIVFLHGCTLNSAAVLKRLGNVLRGYEALPEGPPAAIVFLGPLFERQPLQPPVSAAAMQHGFATLAAMLAIFPRIQVLPALPSDRWFGIGCYY
jgi:hypothetical protein